MTDRIDPATEAQEHIAWAAHADLTWRYIPCVLPDLKEIAA